MFENCLPNVLSVHKKYEPIVLEALKEANLNNRKQYWFLFLNLIDELLRIKNCKIGKPRSSALNSRNLSICYVVLVTVYYKYIIYKVLMYYESLIFILFTGHVLCCSSLHLGTLSCYYVPHCGMLCTNKLCYK